ncbi:phenylacetate--CoA ligase family protein, partial [Candidatus Moduliflexota bacterium]
MKIESLGRMQLLEEQRTRLRRIVAHAYENVPFYRKRFDDAGLRPGDIRNEEDLAALPPLTKDDVMAHFPEGITAQGLDRSRWKYVASSGTTRRIMGIHDLNKATLNWAAGLRAHKLAGGHDIGKKWIEIPPHMCTSICGADDSSKAENLFTKEMLGALSGGDGRAMKKHLYEYFYSKRQEVYKRKTLSSFGSEGTNIPREEIERYLEEIAEYEPYLMEGLPLYIYAFAKHIAGTGGKAPNVGVIKPFGGSLTELMKDRIKAAFGCDVYDNYGCSELGFIACDCDQHDGLHVFMDLYLVEVCRNGKVVAPGELGRLLITDLSNVAMPWIRYDIGDVGRFFPADHGCGRSTTRIRVEGRIQDTLVNSEGKVFTSDGVFDFFHGRGDIDNFQLVEKSRGRFELLCVPCSGNAVDRQEIAGAFREFFDPAAHVKAYIVNSIKAEDGGKFRFVKSKSYADF